MIEIIDERIFWCGRWWLTRERWGSQHPKKTINWYDPSAIDIDTHGRLLLDIHRNRTGFDKNGKRYTNDEMLVMTPHQLSQLTISPYGTGLISSVEDFGFGKFTLIAKLPKGNALWPAWWSYANNPEMALPEVDFFEAYSKTTGYKKLAWCFFKKKLKSWNIASCLHSDPKLHLDQVPAMNPALEDFNKDPSADFVKYEVFWWPTVLAFYINGMLVRNIWDPAILNYLAKYKFQIIINNHIDCSCTDKFRVDSITPFVIEKFTYEPFM